MMPNLTRQREYSLDAPDAVMGSLIDWTKAKAGDPVLEGGPMLPVCADYFTWVLGVSKNKLYQPTMARSRMARNILEPIQIIPERPSLKRALVEETLTYLGTYESIIMPTTGKRILEHPTKKAAVAYARALIVGKGVEPSDFKQRGRSGGRLRSRWSPSRGPHADQS